MIVSVLILLVSVLALTVTATAAFPGVNADFPPMPEGASSGSVTGKVYKTVTTDAVPFAYVAIVNAANTSIVYMTTTSDDTGRFRFNTIPSTGSSNAYRIIAMADGFKKGSTDTFAIPSGVKIFVDVQILPDPNAVTNTTTEEAISVGGRVTEVGSNNFIPSADVYIINPTTEDVYYSTSTDLLGVYEFTGLTDYNTVYQVKVSKDGYKNGYSGQFKAEPDAMVDVSVTMERMPVEITPTATPVVTDAAQPSATPAPGFGVVMAVLASAIVVAIAGRRR